MCRRESFTCNFAVRWVEHWVDRAFLRRFLCSCYGIRSCEAAVSFQLDDFAAGREDSLRYWEGHLLLGHVLQQSTVVVDKGYRTMTLCITIQRG